MSIAGDPAPPPATVEVPLAELVIVLRHLNTCPVVGGRVTTARDAIRDAVDAALVELGA